MELSKGVWERRGANQLGKRLYIALISFFTVYGLFISGALAVYTAHLWGPITKKKVETTAPQNPTVETSTPLEQPEASGEDATKTDDKKEEKSALTPVNKPVFGMWAFIIFGLVLPFGGIFVALGSDKPMISFLGYNMIVVGFGLILGPTIYMYSAEIVIYALATTFLLTIALSIMGIIYPKSLEHWAGWLFGLLLAVIIGQFTGIFLAMCGYGGVMAVMDSPIMHILIAILFCAYIIFDWNRALRIPYTVDNAIDSAVALYLDIINLFIHILHAMGGNSNNS